MVLALLMMILSATPAGGHDVVTTTEPVFQGRAAAIDTSWTMQFEVDGGQLEIPADELVRYGSPRDPQAGPLLLMVGGGALPARVASSDGDHLKISSETFGERDVPIEFVTGILFEVPRNVERRDLLMARVRVARDATDRVQLHNGDVVTGTVASIEPELLKVRTDAGELSIERSQVEAVSFDPSLAARADNSRLRGWVGFQGGGYLLARQLELGAESVTVTTTSGAQWSAPADSVCWIQPVGGDVRYLSEIEPDSYRHVPFLTLPWDYALNRTVSGARLRCGGRFYPLGINMHSASRLTFQLDEPYRRFEAELGIDDHVGNAGSVVFRVFVDGNQAFASPIVRGAMTPIPIAVDIEGAKRISLIVDFADRGDELDHANWLDARLVK